MAEDKPSSSSSLARGLLTGRFAPPRHDSDSDLRHTASSPPVDDSAPVAALSVANRSYIRTVARLGIQAPEALGYAHDQGIVHRDVKPASLLLDKRGDLWVADFGMADVQGDAGLTLTGDLPGTLRYMSPEQAPGKRSLVDRRTDIYALGATLYELLALRPAVAGSDRQEILRRICEEEPAPLRRLSAAVSRDLSTIVTKSLSKDPSNRYETAWQLGDDLARFLDGRSRRGRWGRWRGRGGGPGASRLRPH